MSNMLSTSNSAATSLKMIVYKCCRVEQFQFVRSYTSLLSNSFKNVMNNYDQTSSNAGSNDINQKLSIVLEQNNRQHDILQQLATLRKQKRCTTVPLLSSPIVKQILYTANPQDLLFVLRNRLKYGLFLDPYVSCWLLDHLMSNENYKEAASLVVELVDQNIDNGLVTSLSLKCSYEYLKKHFSAEAEEKNSDVKKPDVVKVRVKFLPNSLDQPDNKFQFQFGKALLKLVHGQNESIMQGFSLIGNLLCENTNNVQLLLKKNEFQPELIDLCLSLLSHTSSETQTALQKEIEMKKERNEFSSEPIEKQLDTLIKINTENEEVFLIDSQNKKYEVCMDSYNNCMTQQMKLTSHELRIKNYQAILDDLKQKKQSLWFFENKDNIDIEIFRKKVYYPKKWFGKKKNVKALDNYYVPPEISSKRTTEIKYTA